MDRRTFLAASSASLLASRLCRGEADDGKAKNVSWLQEIQAPPAKLPADAPKLSDLLTDASGKKIDSLEGWKSRRDELRKWWLEFLGPMPAERRATPKLKVLEEDRPEGVIRQLVQYEVEPGILTQAYLLKPAKQGRCREWPPSTPRSMSQSANRREWKECRRKPSGCGSPGKEELSSVRETTSGRTTPT
jgi:hypothetical protein